MKIAASALHLDALHQRQESYSQSTSLRAWRDTPTNSATSVSPTKSGAASTSFAKGTARFTSASALRTAA